MIRVGTDPENDSRLKVELEGKPFELIEEMKTLLNEMCRALTDGVDKAAFICQLALTVLMLEKELDASNESERKAVRKRVLENLTKQLAEAVAEDAES